MPPAIPTPNTYIQPAVKSTRWELKSEVNIFCSTTIIPTQLGKQAPRKANRCTSHIAYRMATPMAPHWTATPSVWLWGFAITSAAAPAWPTAALSNNPRIEPVPWPKIGAWEKNLSDFCQNTSRKPVEVGMFCSLYRIYSVENFAPVARNLADVVHAKAPKTAVAQPIKMMLRHFR